MAHQSDEFSPREYSNVEMDVAWSGSGALLTGDCPQCAGQTIAEFGSAISVGAAATITADAGRPDGLDWPTPGEVVTVLCDCGSAHKGRPDDDFGCGAYWDVTL